MDRPMPHVAAVPRLGTVTASNGPAERVQSATVRKPAFPIDESGVFCERAELRYRLQYEVWQI